MSRIDKALAFEWTAEGLKDRFDLTFILLNPGDSVLERWLREKGVRVLRVPYRGKADLPSAFFRLF